MESFQGTLPELQDALSQLDTLQEIVVGFPEGYVKSNMQNTIKKLERNLQTASRRLGEQESKQSGQSSTPQTEGTFTDSTTREVVLKLSRSKDKPKPRNPADALVLALQCLMLKEKFACLAKQSRANQVSGFAAPVRALEDRVIMPEDWNVSDSYLFDYQHPSQRGKKFKLQCIVMDDVLLVHATKVQTEETFSLELNISQYIQASPEENWDELAYQNMFTLLEHLNQLVKSQLVSNLLPREKSESQKRNIINPDLSIPRHPVRPFLGPHPGYPVPSGGFGDDLMPPLGPLVPGGGSHVGPNHPMFRGVEPQSPFGVPPGARYDPVYPDMEGQFPVPQRPFPGEPNPDDMILPGFDDEHRIRPQNRNSNSKSNPFPHVPF